MTRRTVVSGETRTREVSRDESDLVPFVIEHLMEVNTRYSEYDLARLVSDEFGINFTTRDLRALYETEEFQRQWPLSSRGFDPRGDVVRQRFADMLTSAVEEMGRMLSDPDTPSTTRMRIADRVLEMNAIAAQEQRRSDRGELVSFLAKFDIGLDSTIEDLLTRAISFEYEQAQESVDDPTPGHNLTTYERRDEE